MFPQIKRIAFDRNFISEVSFELSYDLTFGLQSGQPQSLRQSVSEDFPIYVEGSTTIDLPRWGEEGHVSASRPAHIFFNDVMQSALIVSEVKTQVVTNDYVVYEKFRDLVSVGFEKLENSLTFGRLQQCKLSYTNKIPAVLVDQDDKTLANVLNSELIGLLSVPSFAEGLMRSKQEFEISISENISLEIFLTLPISSFNEPSRNEYVLKSVFTSRRPGSLTGAINQMDEMHGWSSRFFHWATTDEFRSHLGGLIIPEFTAKE